jgi:hypothetical protein
LRESGATGWEFCHFYLLKTAKNGAASLIANIMTSPKVWDEFMAYRKNRIIDVRTGTVLQRKALESYRNYKWPLLKILTTDTLEANAIVRLDMAFLAQEEEGFDPAPVIKKYVHAAWELNKGCPEYLLFAPHLKANWGMIEDEHRV